MTIKQIWAVKVRPDEEAEDLHEMGLSWYRFSDQPLLSDPELQKIARPGVYIQFNRIEELERVLASYPEAKLGPASAFTEALLFVENWEKGVETCRKVRHLLQEGERGDTHDEMDRLLREDTMEDL